MIDILYKEVRAQLKTQVTAVKWIDLDSGQLDSPEKNYPFPFPATFIDFENIDWADAGERMQDGVVMMTVRVACRIYEQTHSDVAVNEYDAFTKAMTALAILTTIHAKLQGFSDGATFNRFTRISTQTEKRDDGLKVYMLKYSCQARDKSAMKTYNLVPNGAGLAIRQGISLSHLVMGMSANDATPVKGTNVIYTLTVENIGSEAGTLAVATLTLGAGFTYVSDDGAGAYVAGVWTVGTVAAGQTKTLHVTALVNVSGSYASSVALVYAEQAVPASHATASVTVVPEDPPS